MKRSKNIPLMVGLIRKCILHEMLGYKWSGEEPVRSEPEEKRKVLWSCTRKRVFADWLEMQIGEAYAELRTERDNELAEEIIAGIKSKADPL